MVAAWDGNLRLPLRVRADRADKAVRIELEPWDPAGEPEPAAEGAAAHSALRAIPAELRIAEEASSVDGAVVCQVILDWPDPLPAGYFRARVAGDPGPGTLVVSAPRRGFDDGRRKWGAFAPVYGLRSARDWGAGDLTDLESLIGAVGDLGGGFVGTLPLLASFLDTPFEPSPYSPASRLFWNEVYVDPARTPELEASPRARELLASPVLAEELAALRTAGKVDYARVMAAKRGVLEELSRSFWAGRGRRRRGVEALKAAAADLDDYARFRAACERTGLPWTAWPLEGPALPPGEADPVARYHCYVQLLAFEQLHSLRAAGDRLGVALHLDLPLGVNPAGYDVWRYPHLFARGARGGAPPDTFFSRGQDWGFPPLHPEGIRDDRYRYVIRCLRNLMRFSGILRVDHVMGLRRLFWVAEELDPKDGLYVLYPHDELFAVLSVESHRNGTVLVGEDLGTVPKTVRRDMAEHGVLRSYVLELEATPRRPAPREPIPGMLASMNTHDMPPFAAFWAGADIEDRLRRGHVSAEEAEEERAGRARLRRGLTAFLRERGFLVSPGRRAPNPQEVLRASLAFLAASPAQHVMVNVEDLWGEILPQNVPGTPSGENWTRKLAHPLEEIETLPEVTVVLETVARMRREGWEA